MKIVEFKEDVWGREVLLGVSWDLLWLVLVLAFIAIAGHAVIMAFRGKEDKPSADGKKLERHALPDRLFHWLMAASVIVLTLTGILPIIGIEFSWLTIHWVAGIVLTAAVVFHIARSLSKEKLTFIKIGAGDLSEPFDKDRKLGKYSAAQKAIHLAMAVIVLAVIVTGIVLFMSISTPWWDRSNWLAEANLGWMFVIHGLSTLGLVGLISLHIYFALRPEKRFYTRSMLKGWISEHEYSANHSSEEWTPKESNVSDS